MGVVLVLLETALPRLKPYIPSPIALGLAFTMPAWNAISMAIGAVAVWVLETRSPSLVPFVVPVASGLIAGESLLGVFVALYTALFGG